MRIAMIADAYRQMKDALRALSKSERRSVILYALKHSRHQFTWSFFAKTYGIPASVWPTRMIEE